MSKTGRSLARLAVAGAVVAGVPLALSGTANAAPVSAWDALAQCESGGNWAINTGNGYYGGLQFNATTWRAFGGSGMPHQASKSQQIAVAERVLAKQGWNAWPSCSRKAGVRGQAADTSGATSTVRASAPAPVAAAPAAGGNYVVKAGDTLGRIAAAHGTTVAKIAADNGIGNVNVIAVGQALKV
ncbi:transglycosylase family protein [Pseudonocardia oroxyli]|uniref:LysM domain-containing protein n=1 Tax=Pseudonocardia oroxyli TaxID=366584 RepID=A0A1G7FLH5_PSEOR|nr:transglycosylase family protein [Pseudonocardia oroxyli]SDE76718.1 LysM domain-containing protein [Pseudonocardia oroxyli]